MAPFNLRKKLSSRHRSSNARVESSAKTGGSSSPDPPSASSPLSRAYSSSLLDKETAETLQEPSEPSIAESSNTKPEHIKSSRAQRDPMGLSIVYDPKDAAKADIVFIHGLGGTSQMTWSKNKDIQLFWPQMFLPLERDICQARILTFGYDADVLKSHSSSVLDFAKELLYEMKYAKDDNIEDLHIGEVPLIFVAHSMGGLIVKEAYLQGQMDPEYEYIVKAITSILFMATPHRGSNLAETLNRILQVSLISSSKNYVGDLIKNSYTLQKINDQFRHIAPKLDIVSFYETKPTPIGISMNRIMVVEKDSSILGYPGELSRALDADHHTVCKYDSPKDPSYMIVRNYLKTQVTKLFLLRSSKASVKSTTSLETRELEELFGITEAADTDYIFFRDRWTPGTCEWILLDQIFLEWIDGLDKSPRLLWLHGFPGSGKSVLSSFLVNHLAEANKSCQYIFLRFGDQSKRSLVKILRSLALQIAQTFPDFRQALSKISTRLKLSGADPRTIWERVFKGILFKLEFSEPLFWIIDGLDECDTPRAGFKLLSEVLNAPIPIRILFTSRPLPELEAEFRRLPPSTNNRQLSIEGDQNDYRTFIQQQLDIPDPDGELTRRLINTAQGNFLWIKLTIDRINKSYTNDAVEEALRGLPPGMEELYDRMAESITAQSSSEGAMALSNNILAWVTCSLRLLTVSELSEGLKSGMSRVLNLQRAIGDLCGGFVIVDNGETVAMVHQTAREYLIKPRNGLFVDQKIANQKLFLRCLSCLTSVGLRAQITNDRAPMFLNYAVESWGFHFENSDQSSQEVVDTLIKFLRSPSVLTWVHAVAQSQQLHVLLQTSTYLSSFVAKRRVIETRQPPHYRNQIDLELVEGWATDLGKLVGKFGSQLLHTPDSIYKMILPFCPANSMLYKQFVRQSNRYLTVTGVSRDWDDSLARLSFGIDFEATALIAEGEWIAVACSSLNNKSTIFLYSSTTYQEARQVNHGEKVRKMSFNSLGTLLVTCGLSTAKVWDLSTGGCITTVLNPVGRPRPQTILFCQNDEVLLVGTDDRRVWSLSLLNPNPRFEEVIRITETVATGGFANSPGSMALSPDGRLLALGYRQRPLSVWDLESRELVRYCPDLGRVTQMIWHPYSGDLYGLMLHVGSQVFKWCADDDAPSAFYVEASTIAMSLDGNLLAIGDQYGNVKLLSTADMSVLYQLVSQDPVISLAFSVHGNQIYDIRSTYGNIWEPNILLKLSGPAVQLSEETRDSRLAAFYSAPSNFSEGLSVSVDPITALASQKSGQLYCSGTRRGITCLFDTSRGFICELNRSTNFFSIQKIAWSSDERYVCYADVSRTICVDAVTFHSDSGTATIKRMLELPIKYLKDNIDDLFFHPGSLVLLACTHSAVAVVSVELQTIVATREIRDLSGKWATHPGNNEEILFISSQSVKVFAWSTLEETGSVPLNFDKRKYFQIHNTAQGHAFLDSHVTLSSSPTGDTGLTVDNLVFSPSKRCILLMLSTIDRRNYVRLLDISYLNSAVLQPLSNLQDQVNNQRLIRDIELPPSLTNHLNRPLSFLASSYGAGHSDTLVFLDCNSWVCSWPISSSHEASLFSSHPMQASNKRAIGKGVESATYKDKQATGQEDNNQLTLHYCLPGDWVSPDCISLIQAFNDGTLLCPRNGEVAVVQYSRLV